MYLKSTKSKTTHVPYGKNKGERIWYTFQPDDIVEVPDDFPKVEGIIKVDGRTVIKKEPKE